MEDKSNAAEGEQDRGEVEVTPYIVEEVGTAAVWGHFFRNLAPVLGEGHTKLRWGDPIPVSTDRLIRLERYTHEVFGGKSVASPAIRSSRVDTPDIATVETQTTLNTKYLDKVETVNGNEVWAMTEASLMRFAGDESDDISYRRSKAARINRYRALWDALSRHLFTSEEHMIVTNDDPPRFDCLLRGMQLRNGKKGIEADSFIKEGERLDDSRSRSHIFRVANFGTGVIIKLSNVISGKQV